MTMVTLEKSVAEGLITYKIRRLQELIDQILIRWNETMPEQFLQKARSGHYPNAENDAIELEQFLLEAQQMYKLLETIGQEKWTLDQNWFVHKIYFSTSLKMRSKVLILIQHLTQKGLIPSTR